MVKVTSFLSVSVGIKHFVEVKLLLCYSHSYELMSLFYVEVSSYRFCQLVQSLFR